MGPLISVHYYAGTQRGTYLRDEGRSGRRLVLPVGRQGLHALVVARRAVDARLDENEAELGVLVAAELVEVLAHLHGLLDKAVEVLRNLRGVACEKRRRAQRSIRTSETMEGMMRPRRGGEGVATETAQLRASAASRREQRGEAAAAAATAALLFVAA